MSEKSEEESGSDEEEELTLRLRTTNTTTRQHTNTNTCVNNNNDSSTTSTSKPSSSNEVLLAQEEEEGEGEGEGEGEEDQHEEEDAIRSHQQPLGMIHQAQAHQGQAQQTQAQQTQYMSHHQPFHPFLSGLQQGIEHQHQHQHPLEHGHGHTHAAAHAHVNHGQTPFIPVPLPVPVPVPVPISVPISVPVPVPLSVPISVPLVPPMAVQVDPILQVQYFESRMRDHAAAYAQYASAAAGAALAAAQMTRSFYPSNLPSPLTFFPNQNQNQHQHQHQHQQMTTNNYAPNVDVHSGMNSNVNGAHGGFQQQQHQQYHQQQHHHHQQQQQQQHQQQQQQQHQQTSNQYRMPDTKNAKKQKRSPANQQQQQHGHGNSHALGTKNKNNRRPSSSAPIATAADNNTSNRRTRRRRENNSNLHLPSASTSRQYNDNMGKKTKRGSIKSLDFMGKTGVSALYDLCNKRHWSPPKFITNEQPHNNDSSTCTSSAYMEFIISAEVNGTLLSKGRGGSKKSAQQDAARKALNVLYPGTVFDANGILLDLGKTDKSLLVFGDDDGNGDGGDSETSLQQLHLQSQSQSPRKKQQGAIAYCPLKDLEANMASRLAIHGNHNHQTRGRYSPALSEDSSISTAVSMSKSIASAMVVTGGPFIKTKDRARNRLAFPSASTTSGISSASEDVDDDEYLASRGASVCSALLNVMIQIDGRIKEQPIYTFDVCANPATIAQQQQQQQQEQQQEQQQKAEEQSQEEEQENKGGKKNSAKRKGIGFSGVGGAIVSKRRSATNAVGRVVTIHRSSFACTASLILYKEKIKCKDEHGSPKRKDERDAPPVKKEDTDDATVGDTHHVEDGVVSKICAGEGKHATRRFSSGSADDISIETLQAVGTGATKREARHIASAKLLAKLFPDCNGMVEVKAAAEAAREQYAAKRAKTKFAAQSEGDKFSKSDRRRKVKPESSGPQENLTFVYPKSSDPTLPDWLANVFIAGIELKYRTTKKIDSADDLAKLSLSEATDGKESPSNDSQLEQLEDDGKLQVSRQRQFEEKVDAALQILNDAEDDRNPSHFKEGDLSKTILRRATIEDVSSIERLLAKEDADKKRPAHQDRFNGLSSVSPLALTGMTSRSLLGKISSGIDITTAASQLWGSQSVVLILSRAIALPDEPPLGFAVLSTGFSMTKGRILRISEIANGVHFPRERLIECLEKLGGKLHCQVEATDNNSHRTGIVFTDFQLCDIVKSHAMHAKHVSISGECTDIQEDHSQLHGKPLQSVKEEDNEDDDAKSDQNHKRLKLE